MKKTLEQQAAATILEQPIGEITVAGMKYQIAPPTTATLIMVSALISELPEIDPETTDTAVLAETLRIAKDCDALGQIAATIILGAKRIKEHPIKTIDTYATEKKWSWRHFKRVEKITKTTLPVFERDYIAGVILEEMTPAALHEFLMATLAEAGIADFFVLTTSLQTKNLLARTEVGETTASGLSSEGGLNIGK